MVGLSMVVMSLRRGSGSDGQNQTGNGLSETFVVFAWLWKSRDHAGLPEASP